MKVLFPGWLFSVLVLIGCHDLDEATPGAPALRRTAIAPEMAGASAARGTAALSPPTACGYLRANQGLGIGQTLSACHDGYRLVMQPDGNLVATTSGGEVIWASDTSGKGGHHVIMQTDGNLVVYTSRGTALWASSTAGHAGGYVRLQDDGHLVVYASDGSVLWSSGTHCTGCAREVCKFWECSYVSIPGSTNPMDGHDEAYAATPSGSTAAAS